MNSRERHIRAISPAAPDKIPCNPTDIKADKTLKSSKSPTKENERPYQSVSPGDITASTMNTHDLEMSIQITQQ